ncbi:hypothetical protein [Thiorhodovibrio frisius]|uniref:DUF3185 domain-containing protein n=1 Tax=Thiorhodovibrio frisius TaxID=631362 RepID=H8Z2D6_9GAMM|nr:hypothetical protein [Thiorhodovibrio frisius]EIC21591.1 hypothetical protein Thi970DRAFT_01807 [Thiorhodovibrio frisius]WPL21558.1 hypothetical protein Thiofri_01684 [Thiorhodovibrio frisius]
MNAIKIAAIALIIVGGLGLTFGGFSYIGDSSQANLGAIELTMNERHWFSIPVWAGVAAIAVGALLLAVPKSG